MLLQLDHPKRKDYATIEHLLQRSYGGTWRNDNIAVACKFCNNKMGAANDAVDKMEQAIKTLVMRKYDRATIIALALHKFEFRIKKAVRVAHKRGKLECAIHA